MNVNDFYDLLERIKESYENSNIDYTILLANIVFLIIIFCSYYDIKTKDLLKDKKYIILFSLTTCLTFIMHFIVGNILIFLPILSFLGINLFMFFKNKEAFKLFSKTQKTNKENTLSTQGNKTNEELNSKMQKLGKISNFNILDVLYIYDYISDYQRRKVIQSLICDSTDNMANKLLNTYTVSEHELKEARAILNLIGLEGRIVTKEEAIMCLLKNKKGEDDQYD